MFTHYFPTILVSVIITDHPILYPEMLFLKQLSACTFFFTAIWSGKWRGGGGFGGICPRCICKVYKLTSTSILVMYTTLFSPLRTILCFPQVLLKNWGPFFLKGVGGKRRNWIRSLIRDCVCTYTFSGAENHCLQKLDLFPSPALLARSLQQYGCVSKQQ